MKKITLAFVAVLMVLTSFGQEVEFKRKHQLGVRIGQSMPLGIYEDNVVGHHADGGIAIGVFYQYELAQGLSGTIEYMSFSNPVNSDTYDKAIESQIGSNVIVSTKVDPYAVGLVAVGVKLSFGNGPVQGYLNPAIGSAKFMSPEFNTDISDQGGKSTYTLNETDESKTVLLLNAGAAYKISELISLGINIAYLNMGSFELKTDTDISNNGFKGGSEEVEFFQTYSSLNTTISLGFNF